MLELFRKKLAEIKKQLSVEQLVFSPGDQDTLSKYISKLEGCSGRLALSLGIDNYEQIAEIKDANSIETQLRKMIEHNAAMDAAADLVLHVPAYGHDARNFDGDDKKLYRVLQKTREFVADNMRHSLLILGESGAGKSTFLRHTCQVLSQASLEDPSAPIPVWVELPRLRDLKRGIHEVLRQWISEVNITAMQDMSNKSFCFLFDSYDEVSGTNFLFDLNELSNWKGTIQMITTCRTQYKDGIKDACFLTPQDSSVQKIYMSALSDTNRIAYTKAYVQQQNTGAVSQWLWSAEEYVTAMKALDGAEPFADTILRLKIVLEVLPKLTSEHAKPLHERERNFLYRLPSFSASAANRVLAVEVYAEYVQLHFGRQLKDKLEYKDLALECSDIQEFCEVFAGRLHSQVDGKSSVTFVPANPRHKKKWGDLLGKQDPAVNAKRAGAMLKVQKSNVFEFEHKSFMDYFLSCATVRDLREKVYEAFDGFDENTETVHGLDFRSLSPFRESQADAGIFTNVNTLSKLVPALKESLINTVLQREVLVFLSEHAKLSTDWMIDALFLCVYTSRVDNSEVERAASNAMTVLNLARPISFSRMDFSSIRIPYAELQSSMCSQTVFTDADLSGANFRNACIDGADFRGADLSTISLGEILPMLKGHTDGVTSVAFSSDGKTIVSGSYDKTVRMWDVESGEQTKELKGHTAFVTSVAFSPDGKTIVSGSGDKTVRMRDAACVIWWSSSSGLSALGAVFDDVAVQSGRLSKMNATILTQLSHELS
jgi:uncharacterized protein YjbI with pentapeptide repeats/energy-coupling factor transporter ATP-binding protein EcfA2